VDRGAAAAAAATAPLPGSGLDDAQSLASALWPSASYWSLEKQPANQLENLEPSWARILAALRREGLAAAESQDDGWLGVGAALHRHAVAADAAVHGTGERKQTVIHGDAKAANFFFREAAGDAEAGNDGAASERSVQGVGVIDFQWTGLGLCATDIAYCIAASACPSALFADHVQYCAFRNAVAAAMEKRSSSDLPVLDRDDLDDSEEHLLRLYYDGLVEARGSKPVPSFESFLRQYRLAFLDYCRVSVACFWDTSGNRTTGQPGDAPSIIGLLWQRQQQRPLVFNACNKNLELMCWMLRRMRVYLNLLESTARADVS